MRKLYKIFYFGLSLLILTSCNNKSSENKSKDIAKSETVTNDKEVEDRIDVSLNSLTSILMASDLIDKDNINVKLEDKSESIEKMKNQKSSVSFLSLEDALNLNKINSNMKILMVTSTNNLYALSNSNLNSFKDIRNKTIYFGDVDKGIKSLTKEKIDSFGPLLSIDTIDLEDDKKAYEKLEDENSIAILSEPYKTKANDKANFSINIKDLMRNFFNAGDFDYISEVVVVNSKLLSDDQINKLINHIGIRDMSKSYDIIKKNYKLSDEEIKEINNKLDLRNIKSGEMKDLVEANLSMFYDNSDIDDKLYYNSN